MSTADIRQAVTTNCLMCVATEHRKAVFSGDAEREDLVEACPHLLCCFHGVRPRKAHN